MSTVKVIVKFGKEKLNIDLDTTQPPLVFKNQIFSLTKVSPQRQKVLYRGGNILKDDTNWDNLKGLKNGYGFMMTGTPDEDVPNEPVEKPSFVEDQPNLQVDNYYVPPGLENLGNTCYMNSSIQTLRAIPELRYALKEYKGPNTQNQHGSITNQMRILFGLLANSDTVPPVTFLSTLRSVFPQFDERQGENGPHVQQDAEECYTQILKSLSDQLPALKEENESKSNENSLIAQLFNGKFEQSLKNINNNEEKELVKEEPFSKLSCHIEKDTSFLMNGLKSGLEEIIEKNSPLTGELAQYKQISKIKELPYYLTIQFVRFYWKKNVKVSKNAPMGVKSKIVHPVDFPLTLDLFDLCTEETQKYLKQERQEIHDIEEKILQKQKEDLKKGLLQKHSKTEKTSQIKPPTELDKISLKDLKNKSANYELFAIISHKGRNADGGHYVAWVKADKDLWILYDDDNVSYVRDEDIKKLSGHGGADWHISYVCLYRTKSRPIPPEEDNSKDEMKDD